VDEYLGECPGFSFGDGTHPRYGCARHVTHGVDVLELRGKVAMVDGDPPVLGQG
jgi:hypothetical protein